MSAALLEQQFEAQRDRLPGSEQITRLRREAFASFAAKGFPTRRDESWHYTDLKPLATGDFDFGPQRHNEAQRAQARALLQEVLGEFSDNTRAELSGDIEGAFAVFLDGQFDSELSGLPKLEGLEVSNLTAEWERFADAQQGRDALERHPLAQINTAFTRDGLLVRVSANAEIGEPLHLLFIGSDAAALAQQPRVSIDLARNSALTVIVHCLDSGASSGWLNLVTEVSQAEGSRLALYRMQEHSPEVFHTSVVTAELRKDASLEVGYVDLGGRLARNDLDVRLVEPGAHASLFGVFLASGRQHIDNHIHMEHVAPHTTSEQAFRGIVDDQGRGVFNGKVLVHRDAQCIDARQSSDNLLLSDRAEIDTKPELEIYADDVKCSHGATVGELDPAHLFYLRARGIDEDAARGLLTFAFANSILRRIKPDGLRERATARVAGHLPNQSRWEKLV